MDQQTAQNTPAPASIEVNMSNALALGLDKTKESYPVMVEKVGKARAALSAIKSITNDEEDAAAEKMLVRVRATFDVVKAMRMEITGALDEIKDKLMSPERYISTLPAEKLSEYNIVKAMRDKYQNEKLQKIREENARIEAERVRRAEFARVKALLETRFFTNVLDLVTELRRGLDTFIGGLNLETIDSAEGKLSIKPNIKAELFNKWFEFDTTLNQTDKAQFLESVKDQFSYVNINGKYQEQAAPVLDEYRAKLPARKQQLTELEALKAKDQEAAAAKEREIEAQRQQDLTAKEAEQTAAAQANAESAQRAANLETLEATFQAQLIQQTVEPVKGNVTRIAIVDCDPKDIVKVFSQVLFACFIHPSFPGHLKRTKQGMPLPADEYGVPQYTKWAEELLTFFAKNCKEQIPGISFIEKVSTTQRKTTEA